MLGFSTYAALLPELRDAWGLSNSQAGVVGGMFFAGYAGTVSFWTALTDRMDGRRVYLAGSVLAALASAGFGWLASGFVSSLLFQILLGIGIAATYMPGLRLLSDRIAGPHQSRYIAFYTSFFGIGTALSYAAAGWLAEAYGWRSAFVLSAVGPLLAGVWVWLSIHPLKRAAPKAFAWKDLFPVAAWRKVLADRASLGYTVGYTVHCLELFGSRAWMVAFLAFSSSSHAFPWNLAAIAAVVNLLAVPASILGNEVALRIGRRRWILIAMAGSGAGGLLVALGAPWHWALVLALLIVYSMLVMAESGTLTAGLDVDPAPPSIRRPRAAHLAARAAHEDRLFVLERVEIEMKRQAIDGARAGIRPRERLGRRDQMLRGVELRVDLVVRDPALRLRRCAAAHGGLVVGLRQRTHVRCAVVAVARRGDREDHEHEAKHGSSIPPHDRVHAWSWIPKPGWPSTSSGLERSATSRCRRSPRKASARSSAARPSSRSTCSRRRMSSSC
jgi:MFS family permease